jgi:hypothetical protein
LRALESFALMYQNHAARSRTRFVFPVWKARLSDGGRRVPRTLTILHGWKRAKLKARELFEDEAGSKEEGDGYV